MIFFSNWQSLEMYIIEENEKCLISRHSFDLSIRESKQYLSIDKAVFERMGSFF